MNLFIYPTVYLSVYQSVSLSMSLFATSSLCVYLLVRLNTFCLFLPLSPLNSASPNFTAYCFFSASLLTTSNTFHHSRFNTLPRSPASRIWPSSLLTHLMLCFYNFQLHASSHIILRGHHICVVKQGEQTKLCAIMLSEIEPNSFKHLQSVLL